MKPPIGKGLPVFHGAAGGERRQKKAEGRRQEAKKAKEGRRQRAEGRRQKVKSFSI
jgi:hypothetical protein